MSNYRRPKSPKFAPVQARSKQYINSLARSIALIGLMATGNPFWISPLLAASAGGITIDNQASGTFTDSVDPSAGIESVLSNVVSVTVAEVAGITIVSNNSPSAVVGSVANFDFKIKNIGNDPTKFFLPSTLAASTIIGGIQSGVLQVVGYVPAGATAVTPVTAIDVTTAGDTNSLSDATLGSNTTLGSIPADAAIIVRVKVNVTATVGNPVSVVLGNTPAVGDSNIPYTAGTNDVYTVDHPVGSPVSSEAGGTPINGEREASATRSVLAVLLGSDYGDAPDTYKTLIASGGPSHTLSSLYLGAGVTADGDGQPNATATGDSNDDGVTFSPIYGANYSNLIQEGITNNVTVVSSGAGFLNAWIDYNRNGVFDAGELVFSNQPVVAGNNNLTFTPPANLLHGNTFARFRVSSTSIATPSPIGAITGGEVEDYQVIVATPIPNGAACSATGLLNGSFETPALAPGTFLKPPKSSVLGWNTTATDQAIEIWSNGFAGVPSYSANQFAEMNANQVASIYQDIATVPGTTLTYQFAHRARRAINNVVVDTATVSTGTPGGSLTQLRTFSTDSTDWVVYQGTYVIPANQYITRFQFNSISGGAGLPTFGNFIDAVQFSVDTCVTPISPPTIDLDGNDSTATGNDYQNTFTAGGVPVAAVDTDVAITDEKTNITRATIQLTNPLDGVTESLTFDTVLAASLGITIDSPYDSSTVSPGNGQPNSTLGRLTLKGSATKAQYQQVLATLKYSNTKAAPTMTDRIINVEVIDSDKAISNTAVSTIKMSAGQSLSGTVFEDPNYGGGAGRNLATANTSPRDGATVELYKLDGTYLKNTTTSGGGKYLFTGIAAGDYKVRVVNSTVTSSRPNPTSATGLVAVQTFRTDAGVTAGTVTDVTDRVGGEIPKEIDAPANTTANLSTLNAVSNQEVQSLTAVKVGTTDITGIDFGYNFDTIVNTNNAGQGSLQQFIINSNALDNTGLVQQGHPISKETSIFMISDGAVHPGQAGTPTQLTSNVAIINLTSILPNITGADTVIDGRTQTSNIGDNNPGTIIPAKTVGVDGIIAPAVLKPEVQIVGPNGLFVGGTGFNGFNLAANGIEIYGVSMTGFPKAISTAANNISGLIVEGNVLGSPAAALTDPGTNMLRNAFQIVTDGRSSIGLVVRNNALAYTGERRTVFIQATTTSNIKISGNQIIEAGLGLNGATGAIELLSSTGNTLTIIGNYIDGIGSATAQDHGIEINSTTISQDQSGLIIQNNDIEGFKGGIHIQTTGAFIVTGGLFEKNKIYDNGFFGGILIDDAQSVIIRENEIYNNVNNGIGITRGESNLITQNSLYGNSKLGIDLSTNGISPNDGNQAIGTANQGIDYPILTSSSLNSGTLAVKGYVGNVATGSTTFANTTLEFFIAAADTNDKGKVFSTDPNTVSKLHAEGQTYLGTCTADANGLFGNAGNPCTFANAGILGLTDPKNITATATDAAGNTSEFSSVPTNKADVLMVKRITAIKDGITGTVIPYNTFVDDTTSTTKTNDNNCGWPGASPVGGVCTTNTYTVGAISETAPKVKPGDEIEYTIYYLNAGENKATQARICDQLDNNLTFKTDFDATPANAGKGINLLPGGGTDQYLTNLGTDSDKGKLTTPGLAGTSCNLTGNTGSNLSSDVVVVDVGDVASPLMGSTGVGVPTTSYGYIRFKTSVK
jgi:uncharacterized repeat protein (TIGR01451 family)